MTLPSPLDALPTTRREILMAIKVAGECGAEQIAADIGISAGAARQHLTAMRAARLVGLRESREGPGRPRHLYFLTQTGETMFPRSNSAYLNGVLTAASELDSKLPEALLLRMGRLRYEGQRAQLDRRSIAERLDLLREMFAAEGFLPIVTRQSEDRYELTLCHCPIMETAVAFPSICKAKLIYVGDSVGVPAFRAEHRLEGQRICRFVVDAGGDSSYARENLL
ncbi:MAG: ArsR family transcriptional regulator [Dehalococcoidia bacterium]|nr:ArsR family transcriptional regulator [Dehalococcoidia bacterium]